MSLRSVWYGDERDNCDEAGYYKVREKSQQNTFYV